MGTFDIRPDAPGLLRTEALNTIINFQRTSATTARISWNIPVPAGGCTAENQAYCGIVITLDTTPANNKKIPVSGMIYSADPTADTNLHAGDKLDTALVVGAFYQDRETTFVDITGLKSGVAYYVSGYPADCQNRYYVEGVHAYSQSLSQDKGPQGESSSGRMVVRLNDDNGVQGTDLTGLVPNTTYQLKVCLGAGEYITTPPALGSCLPSLGNFGTISPHVFSRTYSDFVPNVDATCYEIKVNGAKALTYNDLVNELNKRLALLTGCPESPFPPNTNGYYYDFATEKLYQWTGTELIELDVIVQDAAPNIPTIGAYWYNPETDVLYLWNGSAWIVQNVIEFSTDPSQPVCDKSIWFTGTQAYKWNGQAWCELTVYNTENDPSQTQPVPCNSYWYDTFNGVIYKWDDNLGMWRTTTAIQYLEDPNALSVGTYWFNDDINVLSRLDTPSPGWNTLPVKITISEPSSPTSGMYWYNPDTEELFQYDGLLDVWNELDVLVFPEDPQVRAVCELWWNTTTDELFFWDDLNSVWVQAVAFFQQPTDPTDPIALTEGEIWYVPSTESIYVWTAGCWVLTEVIFYPTNPTLGFVVGTIWKDTTNDLWYSWNGAGWDLIEPIVSVNDPYQLAPGSYWFNTSNNTLNLWNGASWVNLTYSTSSLVPTIGTCWFDTTSNTLMEWNGTTWITAIPVATVEIDCNGNLLFTHTGVVGSKSYIYVENINLLESLTVSFRYHGPQPGSDGVSSEPSWQELGIGTDGTNDERLKLMNEIRYELGYPTVTVELTPEQIDYAISKSLEAYRSRSSAAYKHGFFFMDIRPETQRYLLTNKTVGYNTITTVLGVYRLTSAFLSSAHGAGIYGQIVLQQLYNMGTFDLLSYHIVASYVEEMEILFAGRVTFSWDEQKRQLWLHQRFPFSERVLIECTVERKEQDILVDRWTRNWIRRYALATSRIMLSEVRGKFSTLPGAGGSVSLNSSDLRQAAQQELELLENEILDYIADKPEDYGAGTQFILG